MLPVLMASIIFSSCDEHEAIDPNIHPGYILCDDGRVYSEDDYFSQRKSKAVAVFFTERLDGNRYLAVLLDELSPLPFSDTLGISFGTSCDLEAFDGYKNTTSMQNGYDEKTGNGSPLAMSVFSIHQYGQSDHIPSVAEYKLLYQHRNLVNEIFSRISATDEIRCSPLVFDGHEGSCWYWTSTEVSADPTQQSWLFSMTSGTYHETPKDESHHSRVVTTYYPYEQGNPVVLDK